MSVQTYVPEKAMNKLFNSITEESLSKTFGSVDGPLIYSTIKNYVDKTPEAITSVLSALKKMKGNQRMLFCMIIENRIETGSYDPMLASMFKEEQAS